MSRFYCGKVMCFLEDICYIKEAIGFSALFIMLVNSVKFSQRV